MKSDNVNKVLILTDFYQKNRDKLVTKLSRRAGGVPNAEDVVQEAFTRALQYINSYRDGQKFENWFNSILNNALRNFKQEERNQGRVKDTDRIVELEEAAYNQQIVSRVLADIDALKEPAREVIRRFVVLGYTSKELAQSMDINVWTIRKAIKQFYHHTRANYG